MHTVIHSNTSENLSPVADFGDAVAEFRAMLSTCGVYDLSHRCEDSPDR